MVELPANVSGVRWRVSKEGVEPGRTHLRLAGLDEVGAAVAEAHLALVHGSVRTEASLDANVDAVFRRRGIGSAVVNWAEATARQHFAREIAAGEPVTLRVDTGSAAEEGTVRFLVRHGLVLAVAEDEMRRPTVDPPAHELPAGVVVEQWSEANAERFHEVYSNAFSTRPGFPAWDFTTWRQHFTSSPDFRPDLSCLVSDAGQPAAYAICWVEADEGWIIQMGVAQAARGRGLGTALLSRVIGAFQTEGLSEAVLEVATNNPEARALYTKLGFKVTTTYESYRKRLV